MGSKKNLFGYVKPNIPELKVREKQRYEAWYCGLCRSLGRRYGQVPRLLLSYDGAFLAMFVSAAAGFDPPCEKHACPVRPLAKKKPMTAANPALDYAADVCVILAKFKLDDDVRDGKPLRAAAKLPFLAAFRKAKRNLPAVYALVAERIAELSAIEEKREKSMDLAANCFGELMRTVFENAPRGEAGGGDPAAVSEFGFWLGRTVYLLDAWDDREKDAKRGLYNPINLCAAPKEEVEYAVNFSINSAISAYNLLGAEHPDLRIAENILHEGLFAVFDGITAKAEAKANRTTAERMDKKS